MSSDPALVSKFISRWKNSGASERANYQLFLTELCALFGVPGPEPSQDDPEKDVYVFEKAVTFNNGDGTTSNGRIDLYKKGCFVLEAKQGSDKTAQATGDLFEAAPKGSRKGTAVRGTKGWDDAMLRARGQAESYAKALPEWPPLLIVVDVGHVIEMFADFSLTGKNYTHFPDVQSFRIKLEDLEKPEIRERLKLAWTDPTALDPARISAKVTREIAERLAKLTRSLEKAGHDSQSVAEFLMRCLFTMFAEDVGLLKPAGGFTDLLESLRGKAAKFAPMAESLWATMDKGGFSPILQEDVLRFNGGLFAKTKALALNDEQLNLLLEAAKSDWRDVEPAIFGTLLEQALDPRQRHDLGMHYTPRAYVERLVMPTIIEPLRDDWDDVRAAAVDLAKRGKTDEAIKEIIAFHKKLCDTKVLDPACGSGNFLYVTMELMKRLEGEVLSLLADLGYDQYILEIESHTVDPHQFLGIEINPRAAVIAELVLWIGYLQWHFKTRGKTMPAQPVLKNFKNIECRDAILTWDAKELKRDEQGKPVTRWDGVTTKKHPVTTEDVPDDTARVEVYEYKNPRKADWPRSDFIVGNPPFIGNKRMRAALGDGYVEAIRKTWDDVPEVADLVMYWWHKAALMTQMGAVRRFGLITTNSLTMVFNRRIIESAIAGTPPLRLAFAIPDHPWVDAEHGAAVRIAITVCDTKLGPGRLLISVSEAEIGEDHIAVEFDEKVGIIHANLRVGADLVSADALESNKGMSFMGVILVGGGFVVEADDPLLSDEPKALKRYMNGRDLVQRSRECFVIDFFGLTDDEARASYPASFQRVLDRVKPERDQVQRASHRREWWLFGEKRPAMRSALRGLKRYIGTTETAKHRTFLFIESDVLPDQKIRVVAHDDALILGVLSSRAHVVFSLASGARLGVGNDPVYNNSKCFEPFAFPSCSDAQKVKIRSLGEQLDKHRKDRQALYSDLTITGMYNVLEKLRSGQSLDTKEKDIHDKGLVSVLRQIHDELDHAVFEAYGWPNTLTDEEILERLVALNHERAEEEKRGLIRWLRPEYQAPTTKQKVEVQEEMDIAAAPATKGKPAKKQPWPEKMPDQFQAVRALLAAEGKPITVDTVAKSFSRARKDRVAEVLAALAAIGKARVIEGGKYSV